MGTVIKIWNRLTDRQRLALSTVGSWLGAWLFEKIADAAKSRVSALEPVAVWLSTYILNRYVGMLLAGGLIVGFGPSVWGFLRQFSGRIILGLIVGLIAVSWLMSAVSGLMYMGSAIGSLLPIASENSLSNYIAPEAAHKNSDGTPRVFTTLTPRDFERPFTDGTDIAARVKLQAEFGRWMAITGPVYDMSASPTADGINVLLGAKSTLSRAALDFASSWRTKLLTYKKGDPLYAVCVVRNADNLSVYLMSCELAHP